MLSAGKHVTGVKRRKTCESVTSAGKHVTGVKHRESCIAQGTICFEFAPDCFLSLLRACRCFFFSNQLESSQSKTNANVRTVLNHLQNVQYLQSGKTVSRLLWKLPELKHILQSLFRHVILRFAWSNNVFIGMCVMNSAWFCEKKEKILLRSAVRNFEYTR